MQCLVESGACIVAIPITTGENSPIWTVLEVEIRVAGLREGAKTEPYPLLKRVLGTFSKKELLEASSINYFQGNTS